jgi:hypothetical protein
MDDTPTPPASADPTLPAAPSSSSGEKAARTVSAVSFLGDTIASASLRSDPFPPPGAIPRYLLLSILLI